MHHGYAVVEQGFTQVLYLGVRFLGFEAGKGTKLFFFGDLGGECREDGGVGPVRIQEHGGVFRDVPDVLVYIFVEGHFDVVRLQLACYLGSQFMRVDEEFDLTGFHDHEGVKYRIVGDVDAPQVKYPGYFVEGRTDVVTGAIFTHNLVHLFQFFGATGATPLFLMKKYIVLGNGGATVVNFFSCRMGRIYADLGGAQFTTDATQEAYRDGFSVDSYFTAGHEHFTQPLGVIGYARVAFSEQLNALGIELVLCL